MKLLKFIVLSSLYLALEYCNGASVPLKKYLRDSFKMISNDLDSGMDNTKLSYSGNTQS